MDVFRNRLSGNLTTLREAKAAHPNVAFGTPLSEADLNALEIDPVFDTPQPPLPTIYHQRQEVKPTQGSDGKWYRTYSVIDPTAGKTPEQIAQIKSAWLASLIAKVDRQLNKRLSDGYPALYVAATGKRQELQIPMDMTSQLTWLILDAHAKDIHAAGLATPISVRGVAMDPEHVISLLSEMRTCWYNDTMTANDLKTKLEAAAADTSVTIEQMVEMSDWPKPPASTPAPSATPTPSPTPAASTSPTPTATPESTATPQPTPTPSPTTTPTPTPSTSPTPVPSTTPTPSA